MNMIYRCPACNYQSVETKPIHFCAKCGCHDVMAVSENDYQKIAEENDKKYNQERNKENSVVLYIIITVILIKFISRFLGFFLFF